MTPLQLSAQAPPLAKHSVQVLRVLLIDGLLQQDQVHVQKHPLQAPGDRHNWQQTHPLTSPSVL